MNYKQAFKYTLIFWVFHIITTVIPVQANHVTLSPAEQEWLDGHPTLKIGFSDTLEPYGIIKPDGSSSGIAADHFQLIAERLNISIQLELAPWPTILQKAKSREIDGVAAILPAHGKTYDLDTSIPLRFNTTATAYTNTLSKLRITKKEDLGGLRIVVLSGMLYAKSFLQPIAETITIIETNSSEEAFALLLNGGADVFLGLNMDHYTITKHFIGGVKPNKIFWDSTFNVFMGIRNDEPLLVSILGKANDSLTDDEVLTIQRRWLEIPMEKEPSPFTKAEQDFIDQHPVIQLGIDLNYAPFEFMDDQTGHQGITHDLLTIIREKTGLTFAPHPNWSMERLHHQVQAGELAMLSTQTQSKRHGNHLLYTDAFMQVPLIILARQGTDFISDITTIIDQHIGVVQNHYPEEYLLEQYPQANIIHYPTLQDGLWGLSEGSCDFFVETLPQANHVIQTKGISGISIVGKTKHEVKLCFAVDPKIPELQAILNKALASIPLEQKLQIQKKLTSLAIASETNWVPIVQITIIALIIVMIMLVWNRRLQHEIRARKSAESSLQLAKLTLDQIPLHLFWFNDQFQIIMGNKAALKTTGLSLNTLRRKYAWDIDPSFDKSKCQQAWNTVKDANSIDYLGELKCHDGSIIPTEESLTYLQPETGQPCVVSIGADITSRKSLEQQRVEDKIKLKKALIQANESSRLKSEFLSNMSHEIRTPLNAIIGYSEMLGQGDLPTDKQRYAQTIINSGKTLIGLINDILDLSKLEAGKMKIIPIAINPRLFFSHIMGIFETKLHEKNLKHTLSLDPSLPESFLLDEARLRQILFNIIGNAIKFTKTGTIDIDVTFKQTAATLGTLTVAVSDTGIGIAQEDQEFIFASFQQKSAGISREYDGTGLGLTISKRFIELMEGEIKLTSTLHKGSCFTIILPNIPIHNTPVHNIALPSDDLSHLPKATLLIADDIKINRDLIKAFLQDTPLTILTATNGKEALQIVSEQQPDLIFMDIKMDVMGGIEAATILRANPKTAAIPILGLSGSEPSEEALNVFDEFLQKPFSLQIIRQKTSQFLHVSGTKGIPPESPPQEEKEQTPLGPMEIKILTDLIATATSTGSLTDHLAIAQNLKKYGKKYSDATLHIMGTNLLSSTEQGAIIHIEEQLFSLENYLQESP